MRRRALILAVALARAGAAAAQHPGGDWRTLETAHFRVHVRAEHRDLGLVAAGEAEAAYAALARELAPPGRRIDLVLADNVDDANGFASIYPVPRVVVFAFPPAGDPQLGSYDRWLRMVITHELVHVFQFDRTRGWWRLGQKLFGRAPGLFPNAYVPTWLSEGLAVFYESRLTDGGRLEAGFHRAIVGAEAGDRGALPIDAAGGTSPRWPGGIRPYAFGATFLGAVAREHGDSAVRDLVDEIARRPIPYLQLNGALARIAGLSFTRAWRAWQDSLRVGAALVAASDADTAATRAEVLVRGLRTLTPPRVAPDGRRVLLAHNDGRDETRLMIVDLVTKQTRVVSRLNGALGVAWLPSGRALMAQYDFTDPYTLRADLWTVGPDGDEARLTHGERLLAPDAAGDGAVVAIRARAGTTDLVLVDSAGTRVLAGGQPGLEWASPRFAPGDSLIAAVRVQGGRHDVVLLFRDGQAPMEVTHDAAMDLHPVFSTDGRWLVWSREVAGVPQIVGLRLNAPDSSWMVFTREPYAAYAPAVAGARLLYLAAHAHGYDLVEMPFEGTPLVPALGDTTAPAAPMPAAEVRGEHRYRPFPALWPQYWQPVFATANGAGWVGGQSSGRDALGRHAWFAGLQLGVGDAAGAWRGSAAYAYARFSPLVLDASFARDQFVVLDAAGAATCCVTDDGWHAGVTVLRRRYRTALAARLGAEYDRATFGTAVADRIGVVLSGSASHTLGSALGISAQGGWRAAFSLRQRWRQDVAREYTEVSVRGSTYQAFEAGGFARHVLGLRAAAGLLRGSDTLVVFGAGGLSGGTYELVPGVTIGSGSRTFPVRGFPPAYAWGRRAASLSAEWRAPLALVGRGIGLLPGVLDRVSGVVFADGAAAWTGTTCTTFGKGGGDPCVRTLLSAGAELVTDLGVGWDTPLRLRFGVAFPFGSGDVATSHLTVGSWF